MSLGSLTLNPGSGGESLPEYTDAGGRRWVAGLAAYVVTTGTPDSLQAVDPTHGLPVQPQAGATWAVTGTFWQATQPVSLASVPLPSGAATSAKQDTGNTSLALLASVVHAPGDPVLDLSGLLLLGKDEGTDTASNLLLTGGSLKVIGPDVADSPAGSQGSLALAYGSDTAPAAVTAGDAVRLWASRTGVLQVGDGGGSLTVDATALPLPSGAATSANQDTGNTSLASIDTATGRLAGKYVDFDSGAGTDTAVAVGLLVPANGGAVIGGTATNPIRTDPTGTTAQPVSSADLTAAAGSLNVMDDWDETDRCKVNPIAGQAGVEGGSGAVTAKTLRVALATDVALPAGSNIIGALTGNQTVDLNKIAGTAPDTNSGTKSAGTLRVVLATDQPTLTNAQPANITQISGSAVATGHGTASGAVRVELPTDGTGVVGLNAGTNLVGKVGIDQTTPGATNGITPVPATSGGPSLARVKAASGTNATNVKASAGQVYGWAMFNNTASARWVHFYDSASTPTAGSGTPKFTVLIPPSGGTNVEFSLGAPFGSGIGYTITTGAADSDTGSCSADDVHGVLLYK